MGAAVGAIGIDSASRVDSHVAKQKGAVFQVRYSAGAATDVNHQAHHLNAHKLLERGELQAILQAGLDFIANDEWFIDRKLGGAAAAEQDAPAVLAYWRAHGLAPGSTIMLNHDTGLADDSDLREFDAYHDRYNRILDGEYVADGFYGPQAVARHLLQGGRIKHFWIPEGASFFEKKAPIDPNYAPPARTNWDLWAPTPAQVKPAIAYIHKKLADILPALQSVVWQDLNKWFGKAADENIVIKGDRFGSHLDNASPAGEPPVPPATAPVHGNPIRGMAVPGVIARGSGRYLGSIDGPANSIGGANPAEQRIVKLWQQFLIWGRFVPGHSQTNDGWADGIFDTRGSGVGNGPSSRATASFQHARMPTTTFYGQVWWDDWTKAASM